MEAKIHAIFTKIQKPEGFQGWKKPDQDKWLFDHFNEWYATLSPEEIKELKSFIAPQVAKQREKIMTELVQILRSSIIMEKMADLSSDIKFTSIQKAKTKNKS